MALILKLLMTVGVGIIAASAYLGLSVQTVPGALAHVNSGILATVVVVFLHCLFLFYLNGTARAVKDAVAGDEGLAAEFVPVTRSLRRRAYPPATWSILLILAASFAGGYVHTELLGIHKPRLDAAASYVLAGDDAPGVPADLQFLSADELERLRAVDIESHESEVDLRRALDEVVPAPARGFPLWWIHLALLVIALPVNFWAFFRELELVGENAVAIRRLNALLAEREDRQSAATGPATRR